MSLPSVSWHQRRQGRSRWHQWHTRAKVTPTACCWVMKVRGCEAESRRKLRKGHGGGGYPQHHGDSSSPTHSNPLSGEMLSHRSQHVLPARAVMLLQDPNLPHLSTWPSADPFCLEFELRKKRSSFSNGDEKHKLRSCELSVVTSPAMRRKLAYGQGEWQIIQHEVRNKDGRYLRVGFRGQNLWNGRHMESDLTVPNHAGKGVNFTGHGRNV